MIGTIAQQKWWSIAWNGSDYHNRLANNLRISTCTHCVNNTLWIEDKMYFPDNGNVPFPNCNTRGLDINEIEISHRRISPLELLSSGYFSSIPITKEQIDSKIGSVEDYLRNY